MEKEIDIIIPAYKAQATIIRTLSSIVMQSIVDKIKVTVVNDADDRDYSKIVRQFSEYLDIREIRLKKNGGPGVARQYGIDNTSCKYLTFIDADDTFAGPFAVELLYKALEINPEYHTSVGCFLEDQQNLNFMIHQNDLIWMFGKMYSRSFIERYKIHFNETRANEDNGFNTLVRLCSSETEKIMFLPDVVYYWHYKEDSITRINNAEYSYNQSFPGYTDNMIYAIKGARERKPFNGYIDVWAMEVMAQLYLYYLQTCKRDPRFKEQNLKSCILYYNEIYKDIEKRYPMEHRIPIFSRVIAEQAPGMLDMIPDMTVIQFLEMLAKESKEVTK